MGFVNRDSLVDYGFYIHLGAILFMMRSGIIPKRRLK